MIEAGEQAPEFSLKDQDGTTWTLADLLADGPLVLYFYPADFTPGCTREACSIRDIHGEIAAAGLRVVGVSPQDSDSHSRFASRHNLPFTLLADPDRTTVRAYRVDGPMGIGVRRATFLIGQDGVVKDSVLADLRIGRHEAFIRNAISAAGA
jgi:peroxiredoxin Q/BCP